MPTSVVFLHGFASTFRHWHRVIASLPEGRFAPITLNLADADPPTPDGVAALVTASTTGPFVLVGYSMGGRLALHAALAMPERITRLVLVSTSAGIEDPAERAARQAADEALAEQIETATIEDFVARWREVALFAQDPQWVAAEMAADERRCTPAALARCLRMLGPAAMEPMWERLPELAMGVAVLAGERDGAYQHHGRRIAAAVPNATFRVIAGAGHRIAIEAPQAIVAALESPTR